MRKLLSFVSRIALLPNLSCLTHVEISLLLLKSTTETTPPKPAIAILPSDSFVALVRVFWIPLL